MIFWQRNDNYNALSIKINSNEMKEGFAQLEKVWKSFFPARPFDYQFLSERYRSLYEANKSKVSCLRLLLDLPFLLQA